MQLPRLHRLARLLDHGVGEIQDRSVGVAQRGRLRHQAVELARDHGERPLRQISEVV